MQERGPEDAVPYEPTRTRSTAGSPDDGRALKALRRQARIVGVHVSEDGSEFWGGLRGVHYALSGAKAHVESGDAHVTAGRLVTRGVFALAAKKVTDVRLHFEGPDFEIVVQVPAAGRKHAREFAAAFNTYAMRH
jgi:hypothetical protein